MQQNNNMPVQVQIDEHLAKEMLDFIETKIRTKQAEISNLDQEVSNLNIQRQQLELLLRSNHVNGVDSSAYSEYQKKWPIFRKILFILEKQGRPLSTREFVEYITELYEPELAPERAKLVSNISSVLGTKAKDGKLVRGENILGENAFFINKNEDETKKPQAEQAAFE